MRSDICRETLNRVHNYMVRVKIYAAAFFYYTSDMTFPSYFVQTASLVQNTSFH